MNNASHLPELPWWKQAAAQKLEREMRTVASLRPAFARPGDSILIVTEGTVTEPANFSLLRNDMKLSTVTVAIYPGEVARPHVVSLRTDAAHRQGGGGGGPRCCDGAALPNLADR